MSVLFIDFLFLKTYPYTKYEIVCVCANPGEKKIPQVFIYSSMFLPINVLWTRKTCTESACLYFWPLIFLGSVLLLLLITVVRITESGCKDTSIFWYPLSTDTTKVCFVLFCFFSAQLSYWHCSAANTAKIECCFTVTYGEGCIQEDATPTLMAFAWRSLFWPRCIENLICQHTKREGRKVSFIFSPSWICIFFWLYTEEVVIEGKKQE